MIYFLSDAHLGSLAIKDGQAHQEKLIRLLDEMSKDATSIYLLGDIFDFWMEYYVRDNSKEQFRPFLRKLKSLSKKGIEIFFYVGEHDQWASDDLEDMTGGTVVDNPSTIDRNGLRLYIAHGIGLYPYNLSKYYPSRIREQIAKERKIEARYRNPNLQNLYRSLPPALGNAIGYWRAKQNMLEELNHPVPFRGKYKEHLWLYAKEQEEIGYHHDVYIFGHRHVAADIPVTDNSRLVLLGDCFHQWTYAALDEEGNLSLRSANQID